ncbi:MAG TPA: DUF429 domain-containing protein, partial [Usitatibacter sp.]|nr:DUF429 domain-containing protein [Usitatibacter sp.]
MCRAFDLPFRKEAARFFPYGVYTIPEIASVGSSEEDLRNADTPYEVGRARYENNARGQITGDLDGFVKLVFDPATRRLLGAHLAGTDATELVHIAQVVLARGGGIDEFLDTVFNFPTLAECFKYAAYDGLQRLSHREAAPSLAAPAELAPAARAWFLGAAFGERGEAVVATMDRWRRVRFAPWRLRRDGAGLVSAEAEREGFVLAIGAPQGIASGSRRACDVGLRVRGRTPDGPVPESARLFASLRRAGLRLLGEAPEAEVSLIESCPGHLFRERARRRLPGISTPAGRRARHDLLRGMGLDLPRDRNAIGALELDAAACALAAYLWATDSAAVFGKPPVEEGSSGLLREGLVVSV